MSKALSSVNTDTTTVPKEVKTEEVKQEKTLFTTLDVVFPSDSPIALCSVPVSTIASVAALPSPLCYVPILTIAPVAALPTPCYVPIPNIAPGAALPTPPCYVPIPTIAPGAALPTPPCYVPIPNIAPGAALPTPLSYVPISTIAPGAALPSTVPSRHFEDRSNVTLDLGINDQDKQQPEICFQPESHVVNESEDSSMRGEEPSPYPTNNAVDSAGPHHGGDDSARSSRVFPSNLGDTVDAGEGEVDVEDQEASIPEVSLPSVADPGDFPSRQLKAGMCTLTCICT